MTPIASWGVLIAWVSLCTLAGAGLGRALDRIERLIARDKGEYRD